MDAAARRSRGGIVCDLIPILLGQRTCRGSRNRPASATNPQSMRITARLLLAFIATTVLIVVLDALITRIAFERQLFAYVADVEPHTMERVGDTLESIWERDGSWQRLRDGPRWWLMLLASFFR